MSSWSKWRGWNGEHFKHLRGHQSLRDWSMDTVLKLSCSQGINYSATRSQGCLGQLKAHLWELYLNIAYDDRIHWRVCCRNCTAWHGLGKRYESQKSESRNILCQARSWHLTTHIPSRLQNQSGRQIIEYVMLMNQARSWHLTNYIPCSLQNQSRRPVIEHGSRAKQWSCVRFGTEQGMGR